MVVIVAIESSDQNKLVNEAAALAEAFDDELHVLHVANIDTDEGVGTDEQSKQNLQNIAADRAENAASEVAYTFQAIGLVDDDTDRAILEYADEVDTRYLVVGGQKRSPAGKAIFGSTTQSIILNSTNPVLTVMD